MAVTNTFVFGNLCTFYRDSRNCNGFADLLQFASGSNWAMPFGGAGNSHKYFSMDLTI